MSQKSFHKENCPRRNAPAGAVCSKSELYYHSLIHKRIHVFIVLMSGKTFSVSHLVLFARCKKI